MTTLVASFVDASIVLALGLAAAALARRRSAALRHAILATAILVASIMPAFELLLPQLPVIRWGAPVRVVSSGLTLTSDDALTGSVLDQTAATGDDVPWAGVLIVVWTLGAAVTSAGLVVGLVRFFRLRSRCVPIAGRWRALTDELSSQCGVRRHVVVLQSDDSSLLVTCGVRRPRIILPAGASQWTDDRMHTVIRHELAHVKRHDAAIQTAGELLRVVQWMNPLVWIACRRLRQESEYASDDAVLSGGVEATEYATHLLDVARQLSGRHPAWISAPAIAHPSTLERRIVAMLNRQSNRAPVSRRGWSFAALAALAIGIPLAAAGVAPVEQVVIDPPAPPGTTFQIAAPPVDAERPDRSTARPSAAPRAEAIARASAPAPARQATATIVGSVMDQSGGTLPGARITLTDARTGTQLMAHTDAAGRFAFRQLLPGQYDLMASLPGFATARNVLTLASGESLQRTITMALGSVEETITVVCSVPAAIDPRTASSLAPNASLVAAIRRVGRSIGTSVFPVLSAQEPIRVGGNLRAPKKIRDVKPTCPPAAPAGETIVRVTGLIGVDGFMTDLVPAAAEPGAAELVDAALDAIRQWAFTPTLLNREPVEVTITVQVTFRRS